MKVELPGITVSHFRAGAYERVRGHRHENFHILCLLDGSLEQEEGSRVHGLGAGGVRLSPPGQTHSIDFGGDGGECLVLHVTDARLASASAPDESCYLGTGDLAPLFRRLSAESWAEPAKLWLNAREALATARLRAEKPEARTPPDWLLDIREQLLRPESNARSVAPSGVSAEHLARAFRRYFGATPTQTRQAARIGRALALLEDSELSLADAALDAGFFDQSHFTHLSRRIIGTTPAAYRARLQTAAD